MIESKRSSILGRSERDVDKDRGLFRDDVWAGPIWDAVREVALSESSGVGCSDHCPRESIRRESEASRKATLHFEFLPHSLACFGIMVGRLGTVLPRNETEDCEWLVASWISLLIFQFVVVGWPENSLLTGLPFEGIDGEAIPVFSTGLPCLLPLRIFQLGNHPQRPMWADSIVAIEVRAINWWGP